MIGAERLRCGAGLPRRSSADDRRGSPCAPAPPRSGRARTAARHRVCPSGCSQPGCALPQAESLAARVARGLAGRVALGVCVVRARRAVARAEIARESDPCPADRKTCGDQHRSDDPSNHDASRRPFSRRHRWRRNRSAVPLRRQGSAGGKMRTGKRPGGLILRAGRSVERFRRPRRVPQPTSSSRLSTCPIRSCLVRR